MQNAYIARMATVQSKNKKILDINIIYLNVYLN